MLTLRELTLKELEQLHKTEIQEAFPPEEIKPFSAMQKLIEAGAYHPWGTFAGENLVGYALLWDSPVSGYLLIDYLGVTAARRGSGLGGEILRLLRERFSKASGILVESETPEGGAKDALQRRRLAFYRRNGFRLLDYECNVFSVRYRVLLCSPNGTGTEAETMAAHQALYRAQFTLAFYDAHVFIPWNADTKNKPSSSWADLQTVSDFSLKEVEKE